ncbi:unnamed protein product, partial [Nippostrongylus brasiliensis]|uniref:Nucleotid_trans domain-containing protein n=1 Tax=Nippostrongylus brasiliensis TaxID=27835 RepID=A0A0N4XH54_NIPBR
ASRIEYEKRVEEEAKRKAEKAIITHVASDTGDKEYVVDEVAKDEDSKNDYLDHPAAPHSQTKTPERNTEAKENSEISGIASVTQGKRLLIDRTVALKLDVEDLKRRRRRFSPTPLDSSFREISTQIEKRPAVYLHINYIHIMATQVKCVEIAANRQFAGRLLFQTKRYMEFMTLRLRLFVELVKANITFVSIEPDAIWFRDPSAIFLQAVDTPKYDFFTPINGGSNPQPDADQTVTTDYTIPPRDDTQRGKAHSWKRSGIYAKIEMIVFLP